MSSPQPLAGWRLRQVVADTYQLSKVGGFLYLFGWAVIAWIGGVNAFAPLTAVALALGFLVLAVLRVAMRPPEAGEDRDARRWLLRYALVLPLASVLWSGVQVWVLVDPRFDQDTRMVSLIATIGYATVFANIYSTVRHLAAVGVCVLFLPMLAVLWSLADARALAVAMSFYGLYLAGALVRSHAEYRRRLRLDEALREQRDLYEHLSRTDSLTGLFNRRHFTASAGACRRSRPARRRRVHAADPRHRPLQARQRRARPRRRRLPACSRWRIAWTASFPAPRSLLARLGGEEFGVLFEGGHAEALALAEGLRHGLVQRPLDGGPGVRLPVTVSIGIGAFDPGVHGDADGLYRAVDLALYAAKDQGRNRVHTLATAGA